MSQFYTDFSEYDQGDQPDDWTAQLEASAGEFVIEEGTEYEGDQALVANLDGSVDGLAWDGIGEPSSDTEIVVKFSHDQFSEDEAHGPAFLHGDTGSVSGYLCGPSGGYDDTDITSYEDGDQSFDEFDGFDTDGGDWVFVRFTIEGDTYENRTWQEGDAEPDDPILTHSDTRFDSGWVGVVGHAAGQYEYDEIGVGTEGDPAPLEPVGEPPEAPTNLTGEVQ